MFSVFKYTEIIRKIYFSFTDIMNQSRMKCEEGIANLHGLKFKWYNPHSKDRQKTFEW